MKNSKPSILYIDLDNVLIDFQSGVEQLDADTLQQYTGRLDEVPGIYARMRPLPDALEAYQQLSQVFDTYLIAAAPRDPFSPATGKLQWVMQHLGATAYQRLILTHHKNLNKGDFLIDSRTNDGATAFEGELLLFGSEEFPDWNSILSFFRIITENQLEEQSLQFTLTVKPDITLLQEAGSTNTEQTLTYDFSEEELQILGEQLTGYGPQDDVALLLEEHLFDLSDYIYEQIVSFAQQHTVFTGQPQDLLYALNEYHTYPPMKFVNHDIATGNFRPQKPLDEQSEAELITEWCTFRQSDFYNQSFKSITDFFENEYDVHCDFIYNLHYQVYLPQELFDELEER